VGAQWQSSNRSHDLKLIVHVLSDRRLLPAVILRTRRGAETWDRRLTPPEALAAPPSAPAGVDPALWALHYVAQELLLLQMMRDGVGHEVVPAPPGGGHGGDGVARGC